MILTYNQEKGVEESYFPVTDTYIIMRCELQEKSVTGEFRNLYIQGEETFDSISEFIYKLELMLEDIKVPQSTTNCRKGWESMSDKSKHRKNKKEPHRQWDFLSEPTMDGIGKTGEFFLIQIRYRCNTSWQGEIRWLKKKNKMMFRSVLELLMVLENTIAQQRMQDL